MRHWKYWVVVLVAVSGVARAGLFSDDEARTAILGLRQKIDTLQTTIESEKAKRDQGALQSTNALLALQNQISQLHAEVQSLQGRADVIEHRLSQVEQGQKQEIDQLSSRLQKLEPISVAVDGVKFQASADQKQAFDAAMASFQGGNFKDAAARFKSIVSQYGKSSGYYVPALFWQGNALYALGNFKDTISALHSFLAVAENDTNVPDAYWVMANCQLELKEITAARKTLQQLLAKYPQSNAASNAKERLKTL